MEYREFEVPTPLRRYIRCVWQLRDPAPSQQVQVIYPDGCCELIVHLGTPMQAFEPAHGWHQQPPRLFAAQHRSAIRLMANPKLACVGVRLQPAASAAIAGPRLASLRDRITDLDDIDAGFATRLAWAMARFDHDPDDSELWNLLEGVTGIFKIDSRIESAIALLESERGQHRIAALASLSAMGIRSFQTRFLEQVGLAAKEFARVLRLQATIRQLDSDGGPLAKIAVDSGFADQAHATRELRQLTGLTPARLLSALRHQRETEDTVRLAAVFVRGHA